MGDTAARAEPGVLTEAPREQGVAQQARLVRALRDDLARRIHGEVALIETHISFVLVAGERAYKIKKALRTDYLDQSTLARRRRACEEELHLNARLAPALYRRVIAIAGSFDEPVLDGAGQPLEFAVEMCAFSQEGLWDRLARQGRLDAVRVDRLASIVAGFHQTAAAADPRGWLGSPDQVRAPLLASLQALHRAAHTPAMRARVLRLSDWERRSFQALRPVFAQRLAQGQVRECHGDLHLGNVVEIDGETVVFDGIEFDDALRWIDVISEIAFVSMDLLAHGLGPLAHRFVNAVFEHTGDYGGTLVLSYYLVYRALVRAKVVLERAAQCHAGAEATAARHRREARRYLALAVCCTRPGHAALLLTHGYSGSGKSTLTQGLVEATGAIRIRADVERKRLVSLGGAGAPADPYGLAMNRATYDRLRSLAVPVLESGRFAVLDATFLRRHERDQARALAAMLRAPCLVLDFSADPQTLRRRVRERAARGDDASEADEAVLAEQMRTAEPLASDELASVCSIVCDGRGVDGMPAVDWLRIVRRVLPQHAAATGRTVSSAAPPPR